MIDKQNISRDEIAEAMKNEFGFNRKLCLEIVNDIIDIIIEGLQLDKKVKIQILEHSNSIIKKAELEEIQKLKKNTIYLIEM